MKDNQQYLEKIDLGNKVAAIIDKGVVKEESLRKEYGEALHFQNRINSGVFQDFIISTQASRRSVSLTRKTKFVYPCKSSQIKQQNGV